MVLRRVWKPATSLFKRCLPLAAADPAWTGEPTRLMGTDGGGYFGHKALLRLPEHRSHPNFERATDLGFLAGYFPELAAALL